MSTNRPSLPTYCPRTGMRPWRAGAVSEPSRRLASGRYQPVVHRTGSQERHSAPFTFDTKIDAEGWLVDERRLIPSGSGYRRATDVSATSLTDADASASTPRRGGRERTLKPTTRSHYRYILDRDLLPVFGDIAMRAITPESVRTWHARYGTSKPTSRSQAYSLLRTILGTAVTRRPAARQPVPHPRRRQRPARPQGRARNPGRARDHRPRHCRDRYRADGAARRLVRHAVRRADRAATQGHRPHRTASSRSVARSSGWTASSSSARPKTDAGVRDVAIPPHLMPVVREHLGQHTESGQDALLFPARHGEHMAPASLYKVYYPAREAAGRPDLRWHDLRHTGAVLAAQTGATLAELMGRLGHTTPGAALRYQHAAQGPRRRDRRGGLSALHEEYPPRLTYDSAEWPPSARPPRASHRGSALAGHAVSVCVQVVWVRAGDVNGAVGVVRPIAVTHPRSDSGRGRREAAAVAGRAVLGRRGRRRVARQPTPPR